MRYVSQDIGYVVYYTIHCIAAEHAASFHRDVASVVCAKTYA